MKSVRRFGFQATLHEPPDEASEHATQHINLSRLTVAVGLALVSIGAALEMRPDLSADTLTPIANFVQREISSFHVR